MKYIIILISFFCLEKSFSRSLVSERLVSNPSHYRKVVKQLIRKGYPFAAIPFVKEILSTERRGFEKKIEQVIARVGIRQFETLPDFILSRSNSPVVRYIRAKKLFRRGRYRESVEILKGISVRDLIGPFVYMLKGSAYSLLGKQRRAIDSFEVCADNAGIAQRKKGLRKKQYEVVRDYCIIGKARALFAMKRYNKSSAEYLDINKSSFVWPEVLFEEAWVSFFQKNYNRTLGKLVTYKAPVFQNFFIPEIDILRALSFMELCLWTDANKTVDLFEKRYLKSSIQLGRFLKRKGRDYEYFYQVARNRRRGAVRGTGFYNDLLRSIIFEPGYQELEYTMKQGLRELSRIKVLRKNKANRMILSSVQETLSLQKRLIGSYVRNKLLIKYASLRKAFTDMSYIKLEILKRNKSDIYKNISYGKRKRGSIKYLKRNEKQYFWGFNGEFWADEMGDYVFALPSECRK